MTSLLIRRAQLGRATVDVRVADGVIVEIDASLASHGSDVLDAAGGALIPGLHDHHLHLHAAAAALASVDCRPPVVRTADELTQRLRAAAAVGPVRGVGYVESVAGPLDRDRLDAIVAAVPVRIQHRSGRGWFLNSAALHRHRLDDCHDPAVERDATGRATGRLWRGDALLREAGQPLPDLTHVSRLLSSYGVTGVTDATPNLTQPAAAALRTAHVDGSLAQRLLLLGAPLGDHAPDVGPYKVVLDEEQGLDLEAVAEVVRTCHALGRPVAFHAVSAAEAVVAVTALRAASPLDGDRIEHGSLLPHELDDALVQLGVAVVTQPTFVVDRGDDYLRDVDVRDRPLLYRCGSLLAAGVGVAAGTDAPYGDLDPWRAVAGAASRRTREGSLLGAAERLPRRRALQLFLGSPGQPAGPPRSLAVGKPADLCLLDGPLDDVLLEPAAERVVATVIAGRVAHRRP